MRTGSSSYNTTWYVRDASGNVLAVYTQNGHDSVYLTERHLYGGSRLGIDSRPVNVEAGLPTQVAMGTLGQGDTVSFERGYKTYELSNHLGNVLVTVSDKKIGVDQHSDGTVDYFKADVVSAQDYYPGGMVMPGRTYTYGSGYRYGFNGKENDNEIKGEGNQQDYGMRIYDPRLGRFLSVDPLTKKYPELTPYQFASNTPIQGVDQDGLEVYYAADGNLLGKVGTSTQVRVVDKDFVSLAPQMIAQANRPLSFAENYKPGYSIQVLSKASLDYSSKDAGMTNEELNTRAMMSTLKQTENLAGEPLAYNAWNGNKRDGSVQTFADKPYSEAPEEYADHPGPNPNHGNRAAAGAYQIMRSTWKEDNKNRNYPKKYGITDFGPSSQDKFIVAQFRDKLHALDDIKAGNLDAALNKLSTEWRSLPGPKTQFKSLTVENVKQMFKQNVSNELKNQSDISLPKGTTLKEF